MVAPGLGVRHHVGNVLLLRACPPSAQISTQFHHEFTHKYLLQYDRGHATAIPAARLGNVSLKNLSDGTSTALHNAIRPRPEVLKGRGSERILEEVTASLAEKGRETTQCRRLQGTIVHNIMLYQLYTTSCNIKYMYVVYSCVQLCTAVYTDVYS